MIAISAFLAAWHANHDLRPVTCRHAVMAYFMKYVAENENVSVNLSSMMTTETVLMGSQYKKGDLLLLQSIDR